MRLRRFLVLVAVLAAGAALVGHSLGSTRERSLDERLEQRLARLGFTGRVQSTLTTRLGRRLDPQLANIGRLLWFDTITGLNDDNSCAGCHSPTNGFGDTQPIAIGIDNNGVVGPDRTGPRNMRRAPMVLNTAFFPNLMWNSRFSAGSGDPFDDSDGFSFPPPEGDSLSYLQHLLQAQAFIPPTERTEVAGFDFPGDDDAIRAEVVRRLNGVPGYQRLFARVFPEVRQGRPITFDHFARAIAEFEFTLTFADAPIDRFARGDPGAMTDAEKRGALLFFGPAGCVSCHAVSGSSNEMFSDFRSHVLGVPQLVPQNTNNTFDGAGANEDFGREDFTGDPSDRYAFRTAPLRNVGLSPVFMHDGAFTSLRRAVRHHLNVVASARAYDPAAQGLPPDLAGPVGPTQSMLERLDPLVAKPRKLTESQLDDVVAFLRDALLDADARPERLRRLVPSRLPSGRPPLQFEFPSALRDAR
ncbi:MAG TPA: cytochrome c peroxidase [Gaiellaceae bacterium]|nr:cytochrome c peroxidase [Gaiellaceae bacterium]